MNTLSVTIPAPGVIAGVLFSTITDESGNMVATTYGLTESECNHRARCVLTHATLVKALQSIVDAPKRVSVGDDDEPLQVPEAIRLVARKALDSLNPAPKGWESV